MNMIYMAINNTICPECIIGNKYIIDEIDHTNSTITFSSVEDYFAKNVNIHLNQVKSVMVNTNIEYSVPKQFSLLTAKDDCEININHELKIIPKGTKAILKSRGTPSYISFINIDGYDLNHEYYIRNSDMYKYFEVIKNDFKPKTDFKTLQDNKNKTIKFIDKNGNIVAKSTISDVGYVSYTLKVDEERLIPYVNSYFDGFDLEDYRNFEYTNEYNKLIEKIGIISEYLYHRMNFAMTFETYIKEYR